MKRRIVLLGPPASGKGTQADMLKDRFGLRSASPGAILRDEKKAGTALGIEADRLTVLGRLVPDELTNSVIASWLDRHDGDGFVFDGYPRTLGQAEALDAKLLFRGTPLEVALLLDTDLATLQSRVAARVVCQSCGHVASLPRSAPAVAKCPRCEGMLVRRADDNAETLKTRFSQYLEKTVPVFDYYKQRNLLATIDAAMSPKRVFSDVCGVLEGR